MFAFYHCYDTETSLILGSSVNVLDQYAFGQCGFSMIKCLGINPSQLIGSPFCYSIEEGQSSISPFIEAIYVPTQSVDLYKTGSDWRRFEHWIVGF